MIPYVLALLVNLGIAERDTLTAALVAESNNRRDHAAILYVLHRRAEARGRSLAATARAYCSAWGSSRPRARHMRELARDPSARADSPYRDQWRRARRLVDRWARGLVRDPCEGRAWHWAAARVRPRGRMIKIDCGTTSNTFYGLRARQ